VKSEICLLCRSSDTCIYSFDKKREFFLCKHCGLVFVPERYHYTEKEEKSRYDLHRNSPDNKGYVEFLNRFFLQIKKRTDKGRDVLDFGSGPDPVLSEIFEDNGYNVSSYDIFYAPDNSVLKKKFDLISMVEVAEHLRDPEGIMNMLWGCLNPGGMIGIMTKFLPEKSTEFVGWSYKNDPTHICFYSKRSFSYVSNRLNTEPIFAADDIVLMCKSE